MIAAAAYRPIPIPEKPTYRAFEAVTIVVPTIDADDGFATAARSWLAGNPKEIIIVTSDEMRPELQKLADRVDGERGRFRVLSVPKPNKRVQMVEGIVHATTDIIVFADDDAIWKPTMLPLILACFEDAAIGGVGTSQVVKSIGQKMTVWEVLAAFRLSIRNVWLLLHFSNKHRSLIISQIEIRASTHIDGGLPCLSGRTAAYRSIILKDPDFIQSFTNDYWLGKYKLNSGDDKFLTRWMVSHGWSTYVQCCEGAELESTMKADWTFLKQVLRWTRNTWRSDFRSVFMERHVWRRHPYTTYTMIDKFLNPVTLLLGPCLVLYLMIESGSDSDPDSFHLPAWNVLISWFFWLAITRTAKLLPHLYYRPKDVIYVPAWLCFAYFFAVMKIYALFTLHKVSFRFPVI